MRKDVSGLRQNLTQGELGSPHNQPGALPAVVLARQTRRMPRRRSIIHALGAFAVSPLGLPSAANAVAATARATTSLPLGAVAVVGTRHHAAARVAANLLPDQPLRLRRDPANRHDPFAVAVDTPAGDQLGFLPRSEARRIAPLMDAGGQVLAELDGEAFEAGPGNWRIAARLSLLAEATPPQPGAGTSEQVRQLLRAPPLLTERVRGPDTGGRAVMLAGPCAGWQRTKAVEWVPPGALPLPAWEVVAQDYRLVGGEAARIQTARALAEAKRLGVAVPGAAGGTRCTIHCAGASARTPAGAAAGLAAGPRAASARGARHVALPDPAA